MFSLLANAQTYTLTTTYDNTKGVVEPSGVTELNAGDNETVYFAPLFGYKVSQVLINDVAYSLLGDDVIATVEQYRKVVFENIDANVTVEVQFAEITPTPEPTITMSGTTKTAVNTPTAVNANFNSDGAADQLCHVSYQIFKDAEPIDGAISDFGTFGFTTTLDGTNQYTMPLEYGSESINVKYEDTEYSAYSLGFFDNYCIDRNRPITFNGTFSQNGVYMIHLDLYGCNTTQTIPTETSFVANENCNGDQIYDRVATECTSQSKIAEAEYTINVVPVYEITFIGLEGATVEVVAPTTNVDTVLSGDNYNFKVVADGCHYVQTVSVDDQALVADGDGVYTVENVTANVEIVVELGLNEYDVTGILDDNGSANYEHTVACGSDCVITLVPNHGYQVATFIVDGSDKFGELVNNTYTVENVTSPVNFEATFTERVITTPYIELTGMQAQYNVGDTVAFKGMIYSNGYLDNICSISYRFIKDGSNVNKASDNGVFNYKVVLDNAATETLITSGNGTLTSTVNLNGEETTVSGYSLGLLDNYCINRERPIDFTFVFTQAGSYRIATTLNACQNVGEGLGSSFNAENCDGMIHFDRVAETCQNPQMIFTDTADLVIEGESIYTITTRVREGNGTFDRLGTFAVPAHDTITLTFVPDEHFAVDTIWMNNLFVSNTEGTLSSTKYAYDSVAKTFTILNIKKNITLEVKYKDIRPYYSVSVEVETAGGNITPRESTVLEGSDVTLSVTINQGYYISQLEIDNNMIANFSGNTISFYNIHEDHTVKVSFYPSSVEQEFMENVSIYPNPNDGNFVIDLAGLMGEVKYQLVNVNGSIIEERTVNASDNTIVEFNSNLAAGTYFLRLISNDAVKTEKVVVR